MVKVREKVKVRWYITLQVLCGLCTRPRNADDALYELPEHINVQTSRKKTEDMLSNQMLSGIPEVDLGIE